MASTNDSIVAGLVLGVKSTLAQTVAASDGRVESLKNMFSSPDYFGWLASLARRLLYAWIRTRVFPDSPAELALDPGRPVCYVLQDRRLSNVLVLIEETLRAGLPSARAPLAIGPSGRGKAPRSFFCLNRTASLAAPARDRYGHSTLLVHMVQAAMADASFDVQLVPVTILWGRSPRSQDSVLKALFSETWGPTGHFRQLLAILVHGRDTLVRFNAPLSLRELLSEGLDESRALRKLARVLRVHFRRQREQAIGPDLSHRNTQVERLLAAPAVRQAIAAETVSRGITLAEAQARAREFALEIPSDYSYGVARAFELFLDWLWTRLYDGVEVRNFEALDGIAAGSGIVYLPCHRSHIDYLLLSFIIYRHGLTPPHIAAGINLNLPLVGPLLRRGGAFFLRRSFKGEPLYAAVFHEYLHLMISQGFPIEYFIEGGRSRSGRMLPPRAGILGMTVQSYLRDHTRPLVFVPVYIGYEKLVEGKSFVGELEGKPKRGESLWGLISSVRRLRNEFGKVHVNFGRPLYLAEFLDRSHSGWADEAPELQAAWVRQTTAEAAVELARRINEVAVMTPINLAALVLLATPKRAVDEETLFRMVAHYQALVRAAPYGALAVPDDQSPEQVVEHACRLGVVERIAHPLGDLLRVPDGEAPLLAYFRNNVLHLVALPALLACLLAHNPRLEKARVSAAISRLLVLAHSELFLRCTPADVPSALEDVLAILAARGLVSLDGDDLVAPDPNSREFAELHLLGETMQPTLERYLLTLALLQHYGSGNLSRRRLEESCHLLAQRLALLYEFNAPEFAERSLFANVVENLLAAGLLRADAEGLLHFDERIGAPAADAELLLAAEVRQTVRRIAAQPAPSLAISEQG
ncbi:MAG TPA: glycerol-3-phosphate 1-O-acyltransferase PlsB [Rhodocyclaceae bacterium]|nr:glycerol-3-phosphate 1-O-acyltransferase PlsB [Rhodocyclaceae bacterium]